MTALSLGYAPERGQDAVSQCYCFKGFMRSIVGREPDGAYLHTVCDEPTRRRGMEVQYDPEVPGAYEWAKRAEGLAEAIWDQVSHGRKPECRIINRKQCIAR